MSKYLKSNDEILRYMGISGKISDASLLSELEEIKAVLTAGVTPKWVAARLSVRRTDGGIAVGDTSLILRGEDVNRRLSDCDEIILFAASLGAGFERCLAYQTALGAARALMLDAAATALIEEVCDERECIMREELSSEGLHLTPRFSCGYGDFPLDTQQKILAVLDAERRIGLTVGKNNIMLPQKSVSAVMGISAEAASGGGGCGACDLYGKCGFQRCERSNDDA